MSLYNKYRPTTLSKIKGNSQVISAVKGMVKDIETCPHSFLLHGPTGCGKTTLGRIIATKLGCVGDDFREVDSADFRGIDTIREIRKNSAFSPLEGSCRVWLVDECHKLTNDAQNALLKILEDPPSHVYFILCTTDPQKLLATIRGRCSQFQLTLLNEEQMRELLEEIVTAEEEELSDDVYEQIIQNSSGHPRNAIQILEQVLSVGKDQRLKIAQIVAEQQTQMIDLCRALVSKSPSWKQIAPILTALKDQEAEDIRRVVLGYCQAVLLKTDHPRAALVLESFLEPFYNTGFPGLVYACYSSIK